jgi:hypothetical protein
VDDLTESRPCELHVKVFNLSFKAAVTAVSNMLDCARCGDCGDLPEFGVMPF